MRLLAYYISHTFINSLKKLFRTWVVMIFAIIVVFGIIGGVIGGLAGVFISDSVQNTSSSEEVTEEKSGDDTGSLEFEIKGLTIQEETVRKQVAEMSILAVIVALTLFNIYGGDKSGCRIFTMADVNFLFTAPKKPQSVLLFKTILQMGAILVGAVYLLFQLPNLILNLGLGIKAAICFLIAFVFLLMFVKLMSILTYTVSATNIKYKKYVRPFVLGVIGIIIAVFMMTMAVTQKSPFDAAVMLFTSKWSNYFPMIGWIKGFAVCAMYDSDSMMFLYAGMIIAGILLLVLTIWNIKADFYEDALTGASVMQERAEDVKTGKMPAQKRSEKIIRDGIGHGTGANIFLFKQLYNRKRFAKFGIFTRTMIYYLSVCILVSVISLKLIHTTGIAILGGIILVNVFFRSFGNPIELETTQNYLYMVPETAISKISFAVLAGIADTCFDLIPGYVIASIILKGGILKSILLFVLILSMDFLLSSSTVFIEMVLPSSLHDVIKGLLAMLLKVIVVIPFLSVLAAAAFMGMLNTGMILSVVLILIMAIFFLFLSSLTLHRGRK